MRRKRGLPSICGELIHYLRGCRCILCRAANAKYNRENRAIRGKKYVRNCNLKTFHGITIKEYEEISKQQGHVCAGCGEPEVGRNQFGPLPLAVDHDHTTGKIRGLLCMKCNRALGLLKDSIFVLEKLLAYRRQH